jgi:Phosphoenolpyruvate phosphomutase
VATWRANDSSLLPKWCRKSALQSTPAISRISQSLRERTLAPWRV